MFVGWFVSRRSRARMGTVGSALTVAALVLGTGLLASTPAVAAGSGGPSANIGTSVTGMTAVPVKKATASGATTHSFVPVKSKSTWPQAGISTLLLSAPSAKHAGLAGAKSQSPGSPVWAQAVASGTGSYAGPSAVKVSVQSKSLASELGLSGVVWSLGTANAGPGSVRVGLDYSSFEQAIGGNYASRLRLVSLPACALTTPQLAKCRIQTPLESVNTPGASSVSALVTLGSNTAAQGSARSAGAAVFQDATTTNSTTVLGATDSTGQEGGEGGSYAQDGLSSAGSWAQSGSSGDFTYTYKVALPASSSTLTPSTDLSYDSGSVDGSTSTSQAQSSWVGDGWATQDSYVEQSYTPCADNPEGYAGTITTTDECYGGQQLTISLNGTSTAIVDDGGTYKLSNEPGATVAKVTGSNNGTGTYDTSYWKITEQDGTTYYFGLNELPGYSSTANDAMTNSVDYERVYSAHNPADSDSTHNYTDPCYNSTATSSYCNMAYKWHLDYVVDAKSQAMAYYYTQATNYYAADAGADNGSSSVEYIRDSYLAEIDYGFTTATGAYGTVPDKVVYTTGLRCEPPTLGGTSNCGTGITSSNSSNYPDVPFDLICAAGATCTAQSPGFFSTVALSSITTEQYSTTSSSYATVDSYALTQTEPTTGDATSSTLWLAQIVRTAQDTTAGSSTDVTYPPIQFSSLSPLPNRVDTTTLPTNYRYRLEKIITETDETIGITYGLPTACTASYVEAQTAASAANNTESCFPVYWTPLNYTSPLMDWFNKYAVTQVLETDNTGGSLPKETDYTYTGAAWHYDDNPAIKAKYRTYGQWRGYESVTTTTGESTYNPLTKSVSLYYQGMDGDWLSSTSTRSVSLTDSQGGVHTDSNQLSGDVLETESYLGNGGPLDHFAINSYWVSAAAATQTRSGLPSLTSNVTGTAEVYAGQHLTDGGENTWRYNETDTTYDTASDADFGMAVYSYSHTVPIAAAYDRCTTTTYTAANTSLNIVGLVGMTETDALACSGFTEDAAPSQPAGFNTLGAPASLTRPADVVSATETLYDGATSTATAATVGLVTKKLTATGYASGAWSWQTQSSMTYDTPARFSRLLTTADGNGNTTTLAYTLNSASLTTAATVTNALSQTTSTTLDPQRNLTLTATDPNGTVTTDWYDAAGRVIDEWDNSRATSAAANKIYTYTVSNTGVSGEVVQTMNSELGYTTAVTILDSLGRTRQIQTTTPQGGRLITDDVYDSRGWVQKKNNAYWDSSTTPTLALDSVPDGQSLNQDDYVYDGLGRVVYDESVKVAAIISTTTTVYNGDATTVIPPTGGVVKTTTTDPLGRTAKVIEYSPTAPTLTTPSSVNTGTFYITGGTAVATTTGYGFDTTSTDATYGDAYTTTTDAKSDVWTTYTNLAGQVVEKLDPTAGQSTMTYDSAGNLQQTYDARADYVSYKYDALNRKIAEYSASWSQHQDYSSTSVPGNETASWVYDGSGIAKSIGQLTSETSYTNGYAYVTAYTGFNVFGEPLGETVTIPDASTTTANLAGTYTVTHTYSSTTGLLIKDNYNAEGTLAAETVLHTYSTALDLPTGESGGGYGYLGNVTYDAWSRPVKITLGSSTYGLGYVADTYDTHTGSLTDELVTRGTTTPTNVDDTAYSYDLFGNIIKQIETRLGSSSDTETQCYTYNTLDQLSSAWSATDSCATAPTQASHSQVANTLGTSSAYWTSWTYDNVGNRLTQDQHAIGTATTDTNTTYTYSTTRPNTLASTSTTGATTGSTSYTYDKSGDTNQRVTAADGTQTLNYNNAGQLTSVSSTSQGATSYVYDADGNLLMQQDPTTTVLYLGTQQLTLTNGSGSVTATRYYPLVGSATAVRTGPTTGFHFQVANQQGTGELYLDYTAQTPTWRQFDPYGNARGTAVTWIDNRTIMNEPTDTTTGLTNAGARYLDTTTGRFISLDPVLEAADTLALNGYGYTSDNPVTQTDPSGETSCDYTDCHHGGTSGDGQNHQNNNAPPPPGDDYGNDDVQQAEDWDVDHGCRGGGECELKVIQHFDTNQQYAQQQAAFFAQRQAVEASMQAEQAAQQQTQPANSCRGFRGCAWHTVKDSGAGTFDLAAGSQGGGGFCLLGHNSNGGCLGDSLTKALTQQGGTGGVCVSASVAIGIAFSGSACLQMDSQNNFGITLSGGVGLGGIGAGASIDETTSNADTLSQLTGSGSYLDANAGELFYGHVGGSYSGTINNEGDPVVQQQAGVGVGISLIPAYGSGGGGGTISIPLGGAVCNGPCP